MNKQAPMPHYFLFVKRFAQISNENLLVVVCEVRYSVGNNYVSDGNYIVSWEIAL